MSDHVSSGSDLNAPLGQLLEPISSSETRDVKPGLERKSSNLAISVMISEGGSSRVSYPVRDQLRAFSTLKIHCGRIFQDNLVLLKVFSKV